MKFGVLAALAAAVLLAPALAAAQDAGPDSGMLAESRAAASRSSAETHAERSTAPTLSERAAAGDEGLRIDPDCDTHAGGAASSQAGETAGTGKSDARADRARCRKLRDADIATAPIGEVHVVSRHTAT